MTTRKMTTPASSTSRATPRRSPTGSRSLRSAPVEKRSGLSVQTAKVPYWVGLWLNQQEGPFKDLDVRQAMEYALDRNAINKQIFDGLGTVPNSILPQLKYDAPNSQVPPVHI